MSKKVIFILCLIIWSEIEIKAQEYCRYFLTKAVAALLIEENPEKAMSLLDSVEICDYKNTLLIDRQSLRNKIFKSVAKLKEDAELAAFQANAAKLEAEANAKEAKSLNFIIEAETYLRLENFGKATELCTEAIKTLPENPRYYYKRAEYYIYQARKSKNSDFSFAFQDISHAIDFAKHSIERDTYLMKRAELYSEIKNYDKADEDFELVLSGWGEDEKVNAYSRRCDFYQGLVNIPARAIQFISKAIECSNSSQKSNLFLRRAQLFWANNNLDNAEFDFTSAITNAEEVKKSFFFLKAAVFYSSIQKNKEAEEYFSAAIKYSPMAEVSQFFYERGQFYLTQNNYFKAESDFEEAIVKSPNKEYQKKYRKTRREFYIVSGQEQKILMNLYSDLEIDSTVLEDMIMYDSTLVNALEFKANQYLSSKKYLVAKKMFENLYQLKRDSSFILKVEQINDILGITFNLPNDKLMDQQWYLQNRGKIPGTEYTTTFGADAKVTDAWNYMGNLGSSDIVVAVIDNGFDISHPDLKNKIVNPFDLWTQSDRLSDGDPDFTHGTPIATIAVAEANGEGIVGVAPNAKLMPVSGTSFSNRTTEQMFDYCIKNDADIVIAAWGTTDDNYVLNDVKKAAIKNAATKGRNGKGCVILFAAGNEGLDQVNFYAAEPNVICVTACDSRNRFATYSNTGKEVSVCAPSNGDWPLIAGRAWWDEGASVRGEGDFRYWADGIDRGKEYKHFGGTTGAVAIVGGVCALILSENPNLSAAEVKEILEMTADKIGDPSEYDKNGHSIKYGYGKVNALKAVQEARLRKSKK